MYSIITISRRHGSRGAEIGRHLAGMLGIPCHDKKSLRQAALDIGIGDALLETYGENAGSLLYNLAMGAYSFGYHDAAQKKLIGQKSSMIAFDTIRAVAKKGPCVIVGRCADYVLQNRPDVLSAFIHAPAEIRIRNLSQQYRLSETDAEKHMREIDRLRKSYYNYYTEKNWGETDSYHLAIDSSFLGIEGTADLLFRLACGSEERHNVIEASG